MIYKGKEKSQVTVNAKFSTDSKMRLSQEYTEGFLKSIKVMSVNTFVDDSF